MAVAYQLPFKPGWQVPPVLVAVVVAIIVIMVPSAIFAVVAVIVVVLIMTVFRLESTQSQRGACHCKQNFLPHLFPPETASFGGLERPYNKS
jgi:hypothetical protein